MENNLVITCKDWETIRSHLLGNDREQLAFLLCGLSHRQDGYSFLVREVILVTEEELAYGGRFGLELKVQSLIRIMNEANKKRLCLAEVHSHPFTKAEVTFNRTDLAGQRELTQYLFDVNPKNPYAALVLGSDSVDGLMWLPEKEKPTKLGHLKIIGSPLEFIPTTSASRERHLRKDCHKRQRHEGRYARQILAFGGEGQRLLKQVKVGVVGLGGLGAHVVQQLSRLGVESFVLIDFDRVEKINLNRLVGARLKDIGKSKVDVAQCLILQVNPKVKIDKVPTEIQTDQALSTLKGVDLVFGCVDSYAPRLIMAELTSAYLIPYIDCGFGIDVNEGKIAEAGGRVIVVLPDTPCLLCAKEIDLKVAAQELASEEEQEFSRRHGYVAGADIRAPSVISLDGIIASIAVTEFLALVTGFRSPIPYIYYDMLQEKTVVVARVVKAKQNCIVCAIRSLGDLANVQRYSRKGLPSDIPRPLLLEDRY